MKYLLQNPAITLLTRDSSVDGILISIDSFECHVKQINFIKN